MNNDKDIINFGNNTGEMATRPGHVDWLLTPIGTGSGTPWWQKWIILWLFLDLVAFGMTLIYLWTGKWGIY